jgi:hypothetical protein
MGFTKTVAVSVRGEREYSRVVFPCPVLTLSHQDLGEEVWQERSTRQEAAGDRCCRKKKAARCQVSRPRLAESWLSIATMVSADGKA